MIKLLTKTEAVSKVKNGLPIIFQTDTLPAIGCLPEYSDSIYKIKKRGKDKALIIMGSDIFQILEFVDQAAANDVKDLGEKYWPGPLTMVVPISKKINFKFISSDNTLGLRIPNSSTAKALINKTGPLATSSANISGQKTSFTAKNVYKDLPNLNFLGPIPWHQCSGKASTIIYWINKGSWKLIRKGELSIINFQ